MNTISFTSRWASQRWATIMTEISERNTGFSSSNALQFYFGKIIKKKAFELTPELIEIYSKYTLVKDNDIIINGLNLNYDFVSQRIGIVMEPGIITSAYLSMRVRSNYNPMFYCYLLKSMDARKIFHGMGTGIRLTLSYKELRNILLPVPSRDEQDQIVRFLDWKVSAINRLINIKRQEIALLREREEVYISDVVVKGVSPYSDVKNTGIEWIGIIPSHWKTVRCKYLFSERDERSVDGSEKHLSMSQKYGLVLDRQLDEKRMPSESYAGGKICYSDDLVLNRLKAHLGVFSLAPQRGVISPDYMVLIPMKDKILPTYAEIVLKCVRCRRELRIRVRGVTEGFWRLYTNDFYTITLPVPPINEQQEIVDKINVYLAEIKRYKDCLTQEIELLHECKSRLISDAVTGKIDVRDIEIPEYEYVNEESESSNEDCEEFEGEINEE